MSASKFRGWGYSRRRRRARALSQSPAHATARTWHQHPTGHQVRPTTPIANTMSDPSSAPTEWRGGRITSYQAYGQRPSCLPAPAPPHSAPPPRPAQVIYACNVLDTDLESGNDMVKQVAQVAAAEGASHVVVSAQARPHTWRMQLSPAPSPPPVALLALPVSASGTTRASFAAWRRTPPRGGAGCSAAFEAPVESELIDLSPEERAEFLESLGVKAGETGLEKLIAKAYELLQLRTYYTSGETETKAWTIRKGMLAPQAAGVIHTDFEKGFIRAETVSYDDLVEHGSMAAAKEAGKVRAEGKEYEGTRGRGGWERKESGARCGVCEVGHGPRGRGWNVGVGGARARWRVVSAGRGRGRGIAYQVAQPTGRAMRH
eukprot:scaffold5190_cov113-Isochrysis_galbana.AAC.8